MQRYPIDVIILSIFFTSFFAAGMTTLNELREKAKDATYEAEIDAEMEVYATAEPDDSIEVAAAIREAEMIEAAMDDLDDFYRSSGYTRLSCVAHKVSIFFTS